MKTQLFIGEKQPSSDLMEPITKGILPVKPKGGLWTSTWDDEAYTSGWIEWLKDSELRDPYARQWWLLTPHEQTRIYTINAISDLRRLISLYPLFNTMGYSTIDYERIVHDYDAIHLTENGQEETRLTYPTNLYGWDCESTLWLHWRFTDVRQIATSHDAQPDKAERQNKDE